MPKPQSLPSNFAALISAMDPIQANYPAGCNAHIFPDGAFRSDDGRPASQTGGELTDWRMDAEIAAKLIADLGDGRRPILYDYEHRSLFVGDSRAAGWIDKLVYAPGQGLFAHVGWTPDADQEIAKGIWRYSSPLFNFNPKTGAVTKLISVALTNNPALCDLGAVALAYQAALANAGPVGALANHFLTTAGSLPGSTTGESDMPPEQLAALTVERDTLKGQLAALTAERDKATADLAALRKQVDDQAAETEKAKRDSMIEAALTAGTLPPAQKAFAESLDTAALAKFIDTLKPLAMLGKQVDGKPGGDAAGQLTPDELAVCKRMNISPEDFIKTRG